MIRKVIYAALGALAIGGLLGAYAQEVGSSSIYGMPRPADTIPTSEAVLGAVGTSTDYMRSDARPPRITRAQTVLTQTGGTFSGTWDVPLPAGTTPQIVLTPIAASASIDCQLTAVPTSTGFTGRCWTAQSTLLNLTILGSGLTLNPVSNTAAGISVQVIAIPATQ